MSSFPGATLRLLVFALVFSLVAGEEVCQPEGAVEDGCPVEGNADFYGLGVRMGIYTQWFSSWLANNFYAEEIIGSLDTNSIFLLALFSTVFYYSVQHEQIRVVDVLIIHQLCLGFLFSIMSLWGYRTMYYKTEGPGGRRHFGGFGTHFRLILMGMITAYGVWFWIEGVEDGLATCNSRVECGGLKTWFFASMKVESWATRGVELAIAISAATYYGIMGLAAGAAGTVYVVRKVGGKPVRWELNGPQDSDIALTTRELTLWYIGLSSFNLFWIVFSIVSLEVTLNLNHMTNVVGTTGLVGPGQLIPLAIGLFSLTRIIYVLLRDNSPWRQKKEEDTPRTDSSMGEHKYMGGVGLGMANRNSIWSPSFASGPSGESDGPGMSPDNSNRGDPRSILRPLPVADAPRKRSLPHRILLAWLPWLSIFEWSKHSLTPSLGEHPVFVHHGNKPANRREKKDSGVGFEGYRVSRPAQQREASDTALTFDSPRLGLLGAAAPQPTSSHRGLMASGDDIELTPRPSIENANNLNAYNGHGYHDYNEA